MNKTNHYMTKICSHPGVTAKKLTEYKYLITHKDRSWHVWPRSGRYHFVYSNGEVSEDYYGELKLFFHRYIAGTIDLPENFGKVWSQADEATLFDMVEQFYTARQVAEELERHPASVWDKLTTYFDNPELKTAYGEEFSDVPIREIPGIELE